MTERNDKKVNNLIVVSRKGDQEDSAMKLYVASVQQALRFKFVYDEEDLTNETRAPLFKPMMSHQVFGDEEEFIGYKALKVRVYYLHNSGKAYLQIQHDKSVNERIDPKEVSDINKDLSKWYTDLTTDLDEFRRLIAAENHTRMFGTILEKWETEQGMKYIITQCDTQDSEFRAVHRRFETLLLFYIDGANYVTLDDERWQVYYVYEDLVDHETGRRYVSPVAFCTVYTFFLMGVVRQRRRISQFLVFPPHQRKGIAKKLYNTIMEQAVNDTAVVDVTVEEPTETFQRLRDICDTEMLVKKMTEDEADICSMSPEDFQSYTKRYKLPVRQSRRLYDIVKSLALQATRPSEYKSFKQQMRTRFEAEFKSLKKRGPPNPFGDNAQGSGTGTSSYSANEYFGVTKMDHIGIEWKRYVQQVNEVVKYVADGLPDSDEEEEEDPDDMTG